MNIRTRQAKILATVGPASETKEKLKALVEAGVDAFRLNFSHGEHSEHAMRIEMIRDIEKETGRTIAILQDLQGPKIRIGKMQGATLLETGQEFTLDDSDEIGDQSRVQLPHNEILDTLEVGDLAYINDGVVRMKVLRKEGRSVTCEVLAGGMVSDRKGVNLPGVDLPFSALTAKDKEDLEFGMTQDIDWVALSFVQRAEDVAELRGLVGDKRAIMAKIEMPNAVKRIDEILELTDAVMVARGDLGVEVPAEDVPQIQKMLVQKCRALGKPVVVATQMLESMTGNPSPTRAEVSDVATAAYDGADVLMLSAESAAGKYPVEAVAMMNAIISRVEQADGWQHIMDANHVSTTEVVGDAITAAAHKVSEELDTCAIVSFSSSGSTAMRMSRQRPTKKIVAVTPCKQTARRLVLGWGLIPAVSEDPENAYDMVKIAMSKVEGLGLAEVGRNVVLTAGSPFGMSGSTNSLRVVTVA